MWRERSRWPGRARRRRAGGPRRTWRRRGRGSRRARGGRPCTGSASCFTIVSRHVFRDEDHETDVWSDAVHAHTSAPSPVRRRSSCPFVRTRRSGRAWPSTSTNATAAPRSGASSRPAVGACRCFSSSSAPDAVSNRRSIAPPGPESAAMTVCGEYTRAMEGGRAADRACVDGRR
jgi:hypothetical protein